MFSMNLTVHPGCTTYGTSRAAFSLFRGVVKNEISDSSVFQYFWRSTYKQGYFLMVRDVVQIREGPNDNAWLSITHDSKTHVQRTFRRRRDGSPSDSCVWA